MFPTSKIHDCLESITHCYEWKTGSDDDVEYLIEERSGSIFLTFRQTEDPRIYGWRGFLDWLRDGLLFRWGYGHFGFRNGWEVTSASIKKTLREMGCDKHIYVCGHSMGGALAIIAGYELLRTGWDIQGVMTLGAPRCVVPSKMDQSVLPTLENRLIEFQVYNDIVPRFMAYTRYRWIEPFVLGNEGERARRSECHWKNHTLHVYKEYLKKISIEYQF